MQAVMDHSHARSSNAFTVSHEEYSQSPNGLSHFNGSKPRKKGPMRPSMELRHRQLDLSLLQVCSSAGASTAVCMAATGKCSFAARMLWLLFCWASIPTAKCMVTAGRCCLVAKTGGW